jgi:putative membrane protein
VVDALGSGSCTLDVQWRHTYIDAEGRRLLTYPEAAASGVQLAGATGWRSPRARPTTVTVRPVEMIGRFAARVVVLAGIIWLVAYLVDGIDVVDSGGDLGRVGTYLWVALLFALVNTILGPVIRLLSLPFVILTLGLFLLVINAALLAITAGLSDRLEVDGFGTAVLGGFLIALFGWIAELVLPIKVRSTSD